MEKLSCVLRFVVLLAVILTARGQCYFPKEYLGTYLMQTDSFKVYAFASVTFQRVTFSADAVSAWGRCFRRNGNNVILKDSNEGKDCMRCFHVTLRIPTVIQVYHTESLDVCYSSEERAERACPDDRALRERSCREITLFREQEGGNMVSEDVFCPTSGNFQFTYTAEKGIYRCSRSEASSCPLSNKLTIKFRECSFHESLFRNAEFYCLGDWEGSNNDRYLALMNLGSLAIPFRCGLYRIDPLTGRVFLALTYDMTCDSQDLRSATDGFESFILTPSPERNTSEVQAGCRFPDWLKGEWEGLEVQYNVLTYKDPLNRQRYSLTCLKKVDKNPKDSFIVYSSSHCGGATYNCVWLKNRTDNVMEFQIGSEPSRLYSDTLCRHDIIFHDKLWKTHGRLKPTQMSPCPITGEYAGELPDNPGRCAKVASDCYNPDIMSFTVTNCDNKSQVFEEREYRCLGSWEGPWVATFTYTQRRDMDGYQCFSVKVLQDGREVYMKETGRNCYRGGDPVFNGIKLTQRVSCADLDPTSVPNDPSTTQDPEDGKTPTPPTKEDDSTLNKSYKSTSSFLLITLALLWTLLPIV